LEDAMKLTLPLVLLAPRYEVDDAFALGENRSSNSGRRVSSDGTRSGDYWVVAVDHLDGSEIAGDLQNPDVLDHLASRATRVTLAEGQSRTSRFG
jgi:hypothetical protein